MNELIEIYGISEKKAKELWPKLNHDLPIHKALMQPEIYELLTDATKAELKYKPLKKIPRKIIMRIEKRLPKNAVIAGSYRRGRDFSGDVDILTLGTYEELASRLNLVDPPFVNGPEVYRTFIKISGIYVKTDIYISNKREWIPQLLYLTGSQRFNIIMRKKAKNSGYLLNQRGLFKAGKLISVKTEKEIFELIGMKYREPFERNL